jgi:hypothetical protein
MIYGRPRRANPELLSVYNPPLSAGARMHVRRARSRNYPLNVLYKGRRYSFRELVDKFGVKKAAAIWRKFGVFGHGKSLLKLVGKLPRMHREHVKSRKRKAGKKAKKVSPKKAKRKSKKAKRKSKKAKRKAPKSKRGKSRKGTKARKARKGTKARKARKSTKARKARKSTKARKARKSTKARKSAKARKSGKRKR